MALADKGIVPLTAIATDAAGNTAVSLVFNISVEVIVVANMPDTFPLTLPGGHTGSVMLPALPEDNNLRVLVEPPTDAAPSGIEFSLTVDIALKSDTGADASLPDDTTRNRLPAHYRRSTG